MAKLAISGTPILHGGLLLTCTLPNTPTYLSNCFSSKRFRSKFEQATKRTQGKTASKKTMAQYNLSEILTMIIDQNEDLMEEMRGIRQALQPPRPPYVRELLNLIHSTGRIFSISTVVTLKSVLMQMSLAWISGFQSPPRYNSTFQFSKN